MTTPHRAGTDLVLSYASLGATAIWNTLGINHRVVLAEGFELFAVPVPEELVGHTLHDPEISLLTGCHIAAVTDLAETEIYPGDEVPAGPGHQLLVMGNRSDERLLRERYSLGRGERSPGVDDGAVDRKPGLNPSQARRRSPEMSLSSPSARACGYEAVWPVRSGRA